MRHHNSIQIISQWVIQEGIELRIKIIEQLQVSLVASKQKVKQKMSKRFELVVVEKKLQHDDEGPHMNILALHVNFYENFEQKQMKNEEHRRHQSFCMKYLKGEKFQDLA